MQGMEYLHKSPLKVHGMLKSSSCLLDNRWTLKISECGLPAYRVVKYTTENEKYTGILILFLLRVLQFSLEISHICASAADRVERSIFEVTTYFIWSLTL